jgi:hypothetical protein
MQGNSKDRDLGRTGGEDTPTTHQMEIINMQLHNRKLSKKDYCKVS